MPTCRNFGVELLERRRQLCPTCWPVSRNAQAAMRYQAGLTQRQGSGHGVYSVVAASRLACMFVVGGFVFVPFVRYN
jgi:hypothetical protein